MQHVRARALGERLALLDAESVLLVDDGDGKVAELDSLLDERVRADDDVRAEEGRPVALARSTREQAAADADLRAQVGDRRVVLLGERLGRRHHRALAAVLDGPQERVQRDDGLAGADVSLQQPLHRNGAGEVVVDLADRLLLIRRQRERQCLAVARDHVAGRAERRSERALAGCGAARDAALQEKQLLERETAARDLGLLLRRRPMEGDDRVALQREPFARTQLGRKRVANVDGADEGRSDERAQPLRRDLLARGIHRREVGRRARLARRPRT